MWIYSTTEATSVRATSASRTSSAQYSSTTRDELHSSAESATVAVTLFASSAATELHNNYESFETIRTFGSNSESISNSPGGVATLSASEGITQINYHGFTRSSTGFTSSAGGLSTTSSTQITTTRSLNSYASTTTSQTTMFNLDTTTTYTETRSIITSAAGPTTTTAAQTITNTTSTTAPSAAVRTDYVYAPSTTLSAPVSLVPVSEANPTEQAWQVTSESTATGARTAGYPSHIADTFTKRAGTFSTTSTAISAAASQGFTTIVTNATGGIATLTLTTTSTLSTQDTYVPTAGSYPATATATRSFALLTTATTTHAVGTSTTNSTSFTFQSTNYVLATTTFATNLQLLVPITINQSPTSTQAESFHLTYGASTTAQIRSIRPQATSATLAFSEEFTDTTTESVTATYITTTEAATGTTATTALTETAVSNTDTTATGTSTFTVTTTVSYATTSDVAAGITTSSATNETTFTDSFILSDTGVDSYTGTVGFLTGTVTFYENWESYVTSFQSAPEFGSTRATTTYDGAAGATQLSTFYYSSFYSESSSFFSRRVTLVNNVFNIGDSTSSTSGSLTTSTESTASDSLSYTVAPETYTATTDSFTSSSTTVTTATTTTYVASFTVSATTTATTTTSATTFIDGTTTAAAPYSQSSGSSYTQSEGISYTYPLLYSLSTFMAVTPWTAHAMHPRQGFRHPLSLAASDAAFSILSVVPAGFAYPRQATQDDAAGPITPALDSRTTAYTTGGVAYTAAWSSVDARLHITSGATSTTTTATATFSFSGATPATWYSPRISSAANQGSSVGGVPVDSKFGVAIYFPAGVRHITTQAAGASASSTSWITSPESFANSSSGFALPATTESVWSVTKRQTAWTYDFFGSSAASTGETSTPVMLLSLNPNL